MIERATVQMTYKIMIIQPENKKLHESHYEKLKLYLNKSAIVTDDLSGVFIIFIIIALIPKLNLL